MEERINNDLEKRNAILEEQLANMVERCASMENAYALEKANRDLIIQECNYEKDKEIELLRQQLSEAKAHIASMESRFESEKEALKEEVAEQVKEQIKDQYSKEF